MFYHYCLPIFLLNKWIINYNVVGISKPDTLTAEKVTVYSWQGDIDKGSRSYISLYLLVQ